MLSQVYKPTVLAKIVRQCIQQVTPQYNQIAKLYNFCKVGPPDVQKSRNIESYTQTLLVLLKYISQYIVENMVQNKELLQLKQEKLSMTNKLEKMKKENIQLKCQIDVLNIKIRQQQLKQIKAIQEKHKQRRYSLEYQNKLNKIKQDSQQGLKKIIQASKSQQLKSFQRNNCFPSVKSYANRQKIGLLLLMGTPDHKPPRRNTHAASLKKI